MYLVCRHIKPGGQRCKSPALRGHAFCYFHARLHSTSRLGVTDSITLPIPEDSVAIQVSLGTIFEAILSSRIDSKQTAQLLWGLQIAANNLSRKPASDQKSVLSVTRNKQGLELAPVLRVCNSLTDCQNGCEYPASCGRNRAFDALLGRTPETDEPSETGKTDTGKDKLALARWDGTNAEGEIVDREAFMRRFGDDDNDEDDDDDEEEDGKTLLGTLLTLHDLKESLELDD
jgi:hypothetical protein